MKRFFGITLLLLLLTTVVSAQQITGEIYDSDGYPIPLASAIYKGHHVAEASDINGKFSIARHNGWELTFSSVGFQPQTIKVSSSTPLHLKIVLKEDSRSLGEVVIKQKRERYSRKNNPAVELMKRVIAAKKRTISKTTTIISITSTKRFRLPLTTSSPKTLLRAGLRTSRMLRTR